MICIMVMIGKLCSSKNSDGNKTSGGMSSSSPLLCSSKNSDGNKTVLPAIYFSMRYVLAKIQMVTKQFDCF